MKIDFRKPHLALPAIAFPFILIFFYAYKSFNNRPAGSETSPATSDSLQGSIAQVSDQVKKQPLASKLSAYKQQYRDGDGYTAIKQLQADQLEEYRFDELYSKKEKDRLDSLEKALKQQPPVIYSVASHLNNTDQQWAQQQRTQDLAVQQALASLSAPAQEPKAEPTTVAPDPMELFRMQMAYADSMAKANDPELQEKLRSEQPQQKLSIQDSAIHAVTRYERSAGAFNTLRAEQKETPIQAIIDQTITGTIDSRVRIRLLEDLLVGGQHIKRGTYLYANMSGFSAQRVMLSITSILNGRTILPVKLEIYDNDGAQGLYVPASAFREFSKQLSSSSVQGVSLQQQAAGNSQMVMGALQRMFQSTSSAVSKHIRKNKAKLKYNTLVYLVDQGAKQ